LILAKEKFMLLKKKENQETGGDTDEAGAKTKKTHNFLLCDFVKLRNATKDKAMQDVINEFIKKRFKE
jgi:hypothetical protein